MAKIIFPECEIVNLNSARNAFSFPVVPGVRLELTIPFENTILSRARRPIPPPGQARSVARGFSHDVRAKLEQGFLARAFSLSYRTV